MRSSAVELQRDLFARSAAGYNEKHVHSGDEPSLALEHIFSLIQALDIKTTLDVGCGTGRGVRYLLNRGISVQGIEPVSAMLDQAVLKQVVPPHLLIRGEAQSLPFPDKSFDAVCELGMLHHVPDPDAVVREMLRVARKAIFIADSNRFGQGPVAARWLKLLLWKIHLWQATDWIKTLGKRYVVSDGDGLIYSYSVYDSLDLVARWADRTILIPTSLEKPRSWLHPLLTSSQVLLCGIRET
jgi:ubiquinone/menaquinone biosynthesis C-methylase UbiE